MFACCLSISTRANLSPRIGRDRRRGSNVASRGRPRPAFACRSPHCPPDVNRRALAVEIQRWAASSLSPAPPSSDPFSRAHGARHRPRSRKPSLGPAIFEGYVPGDEAGLWSKMAIAADPGVLEINLPPCLTWRDYESTDGIVLWNSACVPRDCAPSSKSPPKIRSAREEEITLLFGGPTLDDQSPLHPSKMGHIDPAILAASSGARLSFSPANTSAPPRKRRGPMKKSRPPRMRSGKWPTCFSSSFPPGDHRYMISETLRHLHTDTSGQYAPQRDGLR